MSDKKPRKPRTKKQVLVLRLTKSTTDSAQTYIRETLADSTAEGVEWIEAQGKPNETYSVVTIHREAKVTEKTVRELH